MNFEELISFCRPLSVTGSAPDSLGSLCQDSRTVKNGDLFIAVKGATVDGHQFINDAIKKGASVIISEQTVELKKDIAVLLVEDTRKLLGPLAQKLAGNPAEKLTIIGVTGTNGKTTVATLVWQVLTKLGINASLLGTVSKKINKKEYPSRLTTADPIELASDMVEMVEAGSNYLVMEVSSHALHQQRVLGIPFYVAVFTNLSHDHLDYHKTINEYATAKKILFNSLENDTWAVTNTDDERGEWITNSTKAKVLSFSFEGKGLIMAKIIQADETGTILSVEGTEFLTPLIGLFNAYNVVGALLTCTALGFDGKQIAEVLQYCTGAPGRMERVNQAELLHLEPLVLVDYAHTPDALENVASTIKDLSDDSKPLTIIFGCGGDRDKAKRPEMAKIAEKYADRVVVTTDNPRTEDPESIISDISREFYDQSKISAITSREEAIRKTIAEAKIQSIILIAGKGHETYQEISGKRIHFDDREIARDALSNRMDQQNSGGVN
ncbi:MAG: UDP-N-acetylmuramoyl-L-alanyl-D-glutamate--2,6-diaminopimelate ligase [Balneolaceae bacterium]